MFGEALLQAAAIFAGAQVSDGGTPTAAPKNDRKCDHEGASFMETLGGKVWVCGECS